jgi:hypothetical protein
MLMSHTKLTAKSWWLVVSYLRGNAMSFELIYPDVLGSVTSGTGRFITEGLQYAVGVFPKQAFVNQPLEVVVALQNMLDAPLPVSIVLSLPTRDRKGRPVTIDAAKRQFKLELGAGESGIVRLPLLIKPPTQAGSGFPVRIVVRTVPNKKAQAVRPPDGGPLPSVLAVSPFHLQVLQDIDFSDVEATGDAHVVKFNVAAKQLPPRPLDLQARYERLWSVEQVDEEMRLAESHIKDARYVAFDSPHGTTYWHFLEVVGEHFAVAGLPLHPGEERAIAKMMAYTVDHVHAESNQLKRERDEDSRWFRELCQLIAHDENMATMPRGELMVRYLFDAVLYDAILQAFAIVQKRVKENLGDEKERVNYANRVLTWMVTGGNPDLNYIYLPLVMGGLLINKMVMLSATKGENEWVVSDQLREAYRGRTRLAAGETVVVFDMLAKLLDEVEADMRMRHVPRP